MLKFFSGNTCLLLFAFSFIAFIAPAQKRKIDPLLILSRNQITEIRGDKRSVGGGNDTSQPFTNHILSIYGNDAVYLFSDGYADQFGGDKGKKMMRKNFNQLLLNNAHLPMQEQLKVLENRLAQWKGNYEQVDDICVVGFRA